MINRLYLSKALLSLGLGIFILVGGFAVQSFADSNFSDHENRIDSSDFGKLIAGTYVESRKPQNGTSRILTIFADNNLSSIQSIQFETEADGSSFSDQQGTWKRTGQSKIKATVLDISYLSTSGEFHGVAIATYDLEFSKDFQTITGVTNGKIFAPGVDPQNPDEDPLATFTDNFTVKRVIVKNED